MAAFRLKAVGLIVGDLLIAVEGQGEWLVVPWLVSCCL